MSDTIVGDVRNSVLTKYVGVAGFTVLLWDHVLTFPDEVEYIWKGEKGLAVYLFLLNRYLIPLSFCVNTYAYFSTTWTPQSAMPNKTPSCSGFVRFEGSMTMIGISVVALMMFLRIRALYARFLSVQAFVLAIFFTFIGVNSYLLTRGVPVRHVANSGVDSCTMIIDPKVPALASSSAWLPLLYDTIVIFLTVNRTASSAYSRSRNPSQLFRVLLQEGLMYYFVICTITLILTIMILHADQSIRNTTAQLHLCFTVAMMSRITLRLKRFARNPGGVIHHDAAPRPFGPDTVVSMGPPVFAVPATRCTPHVTFLNEHSNDAPAAPATSGNDTYFAMDTFSTGTVTKEFDA